MRQAGVWRVGELARQTGLTVPSDSPLIRFGTTFGSQTFRPRR